VATSEQKEDNPMSHIRLTLLPIAFAVAATAGFGAEIRLDDFYQKGSTWHETIASSLFKLTDLQKKQSPGSVDNFEKFEEQKGVALSSWQTLPPFKGKNLDQDCGPEASLDTQPWIRKTDWRAGYVVNLTMPDNSVQYCYCKLFVDAPKTVTAYLGSDDGIAVFLNGQKVMANNASRGVEANQDKAQLSLVKGVNHLLLKIYNGGGGSGFYFSLDERPKGSLNSDTQGVSKEDPLRENLWARLRQDFGKDATAVWEMDAEKKDGIWAGRLEGDPIKTMAGRYAAKTKPYEGLDKQAKALAGEVKDAASLAKLRELYYKSVKMEEEYGPKNPAAPNNGLPPWLPPEKNAGVRNGPLMEGGHRASGEGNRESLKLAIEDLISTFGDKYPKGKEYLARLEKIADEKSADFAALKKEALLANPLLDFDRLLMIRHRKGGRYTANWQTQTSAGGPFENELVVMSPLCEGEVKVVYQPPPGKYVGDVDLHFDADKVLFSTQVDDGALTKVPNTKRSRGYALFEIDIDPKTGERRGEARMISPNMGWDVDNFDGVYLPNDRIIFASTAAYEGVPCVGGSDYVANLYIMDRDGKNVRRLTFDQDASWHPSVMESGRVMYTRWEYTDSAHYFSRVLMTMNPDGTDQKGYYGSNSYWPNSMFFARQTPGSPSKFVATITGHHSHAKGGALCLFDVLKGREEADGALQFFTGRGKKVEPIVLDDLARVYSPMFFHPFPLSDKYCLAMTGNSIYLMDVFDNMLCLKKSDKDGGYCEPVPLRRTKRPPVRADMVDLKSKVATVLISDLHNTPGLEGVPPGTVKKIRVFRYEYGPRHTGGHYAMGMETCWDARQILGTAHVEDDGSASFEIPANTPVSLQPLDAEGRAVQIMRSWLVGMPGEKLSCIGCHESQNMASPIKTSKAMQRKPEPLTPWYGPARGFSFTSEVMPVIDRYCAGCHDGKPGLDRFEKMGVKVQDRICGTGPCTGKKFSEVGIPSFENPGKAFANLHPYVRRNGPEGDYHLLTPLEFHADTSELIQMLKKGHHNVRLDDESWDRLYTWMDLNAPFKGSWTESGADQSILKRRMELRKLYAFDDFNPEAPLKPYAKSDTFVMPEAPRSASEVKPEKPVVKEAPSGGVELELGNGVKMKLVRIPSGEFSMGSNDETPMEQPVTRVKIDKSFLMGATEVTLEQYRQFDPKHLNGVYDMHYKDQVHRGYYMNVMTLPVIRVSWTKAMEFCAWLSKKTGKKVTLPTEAQWEWACRAGTETPLSYGGLDTQFSKHANMADITVKLMAVTGVNPHPIQNPGPDVDFELKDPRSDDDTLFLAEVGKFLPNPWGLYDMHGNAAEWTRSDYKPYPYKDSDGRNAGSADAKKVVRGGSWKDRPFRCTSSYRLGYPTWQRVFNTGFRVIIEE